MRRNLITPLINWKNKDYRKPLLLDGARQTGKTYLIEAMFGRDHFQRTHKFDFREDQGLKKYFAERLSADRIIKNLEIHQGRDIDLKSDLIFFDEIGECQGAVDSLKYFAESMPHMFLVASGSNIGLLESFPVGAVELKELYPLTFEEFLDASGEEELLTLFKEQSRLMAAHDRIWSHLLDYYFVGGMPEAVKYWFSATDIGINQRCIGVTDIHRGITSGYYRDFGKYAGKANALQIEAVFRNIPIQLARTLDGSVSRYKFRDVVVKKNRYTELATPIDWLVKTKLASKNYVINCEPVSPLQSRIKENIFKLFFFDIGLLGYLLEISYKEQREQSMMVKGFIAENFVQCELMSQGIKHTYSWAEGDSEIEFLIKLSHGTIVPVEVKSGKRTRAKSLTVFRERYQPPQVVKLVGTAGGNDTKTVVWPLYYASKLQTI